MQDVMDGGTKVNLNLVLAIFLMLSRASRFSNLVL